MKRAVLGLILLVLAPMTLRAQNTGTGLPPFGSLSSFGFDAVNNRNLNVYFAIPLVSSQGRGLPLNLTLINNSLLWQKVNNTWTPVVDAAGNPTWGWLKDMPPGGIFKYRTTTNLAKCFQGGSWFFTTVYWYGDFVYIDALGTAHSFPSYTRTAPDCPAFDDGTSTSYASDASGYFLKANNPAAAAVTSPRGEELVNGSGTAVDVNGNYITKTVVSSTETDYTDSVGNRALKVIYTPNATSPTSIQYQFLDGNGAYQTITLKLQAYSIKTNFACSGVTEYTGTAYLPYELDIPSPVSGILKYLFAYEDTPNISGYFTGRVKKVTLPTGGYYEYDYPTAGANDGINCSDGTTTS